MLADVANSYQEPSTLSVSLHSVKLPRFAVLLTDKLTKRDFILWKAISDEITCILAITAVLTLVYHHPLVEKMV